MSDRTTALVLSLLMVASAATIGAAASGGTGVVASQDAAGTIVDSLDDPRDANRTAADDRGSSRGDGGTDHGGARGERGSGDDDRRDRGRDRGGTGDGTGTDDADSGNETESDADDETPSVSTDQGSTGILHSVTLPPNPTPTFTQPDGTTFEARFWSEGITAGWRTTDGYTIVKGDDGYWHYATREDGLLAPTGSRVGVDQIQASLSKRVTPTGPTESGSQATTGGPQATEGTTDSISAETVDSTGTAKFPVVLINFNDTSTSFTESEFQSLLFGNDPSIATGPGSVTDYYEEASYGQLTVTGNVEGWVTADYNQSYYGECGVKNYCSKYGGYNADELVKEAAQKADAQINFSKYDNDNDGEVDQFAVVHQGGGEEVTGNQEDIWSHKYALSATIGSYTTDEGVTVDEFVIQPEELYESTDTMSTIGVFAHEFGHAFGLPDLYDTDGSSAGIGRWGLMASGSYGTVTRSGDAPNHMTAWSKEFMGWIDPPEVTDGESVSGTTLRNVSKNNDYLKVLNETNNTYGEYFYVQNRQGVGFDQGLDGEGLLITHINESKDTLESCIVNNDCNDDETNKLVDVEAADGNRDLDKDNNRGDAGDPWGEGESPFDDASTPDSKYNNGTSSNASASAIQFSGGTTQGTATLDVEVTSPVTLLDQQWSETHGGRAQYASPGAGPDRVFLGGLGSGITAVYRDNGSTAWTFSRSGSLADSSPVHDSGTVYVGSGGGELYAIDAAGGTESWSYTTDSAIVSTPAVAGGTVYVGSNDGTLLAVDAGTGSEQWTLETGAPIYSTIEVAGDNVYATLDNGTVLAIDTTTQTRLWKYDTGASLGHSSPTHDGGTVYVASDDVYAFDGSLGTVTWQTNTDENVGSSPVVYDGRVFVGVQNGTVHALNTVDGSTDWSYSTVTTVGSTAAAANDRVVFGDDSGTVYLLNATTGTELKTASISGQRVRSGPTIAGGTVYVGADSGDYVSLANIKK